MPGSWPTAATRSRGSVPSASSAGRLTSSWRPASDVIDEENGRVNDEGDEACGGSDEQIETGPGVIGRRLNQPVNHAEADKAPGKPNVDWRVEAHEHQREHDRVESCRLLPKS